MMPIADNLNIMELKAEQIIQVDNLMVLLSILMR
jgi:hypothetical protein